MLANGSSATVTFSANVTDDGLPNGTLTAQWVQLSGPLPVVFSAANALNTQITFTAAGVYSFHFSSSDSQLTTVETFRLAGSGYGQSITSTATRGGMTLALSL